MTKKIQVGKSWYRVILTLHVLERIKSRGINPSDILPAIVDYIKKHDVVSGNIMLEVTKKNFSLVLNVKKNNIKLITVINKINCSVKAGTEKVAV